jgi:nicotinate-nucleotide adenylyltransferase
VTKLQVTKAEPVTRHPSSVTQKAIGLLGGTFDPIHHGHLRLAEEMGAALGLDQVRIMPAGIPPHRTRPLADTAHRRAMVELAIADNPRFRLEAIELDKSGPCFMVETLAELRSELGATIPLVLIVGADAFAGLSTWHEWPRLFSLCHFAVAQRPGYTSWQDMIPEALAGEYLARRITDSALLACRPAGYVITHAITQMDIAASRIRADIAAGHSPRYLLPDAVLNYIDNNHLYH